MASFERRRTDESPPGLLILRSPDDEPGTSNERARTPRTTAAHPPLDEPTQPQLGPRQSPPRPRRHAPTPEASGSSRRLLVGEREHRLYVLQSETIDYIESHGNYVKFHVDNSEYISRDSVKRLYTVLGGSSFVRIERSLLINTRAIWYVERAGRGTYAFTLLCGSCLHSGATFRDEILRVLPLAHVPASRTAAIG
jgi:hypothetical protein